MYWMRCINVKFTSCTFISVDLMEIMPYMYVFDMFVSRVLFDGNVRREHQEMLQFNRDTVFCGIYKIKINWKHKQCSISILL